LYHTLGRKTRLSAPKEKVAVPILILALTFSDLALTLVSYGSAASNNRLGQTDKTIAIGATS